MDKNIFPFTRLFFLSIFSRFSFPVLFLGSEFAASTPSVSGRKGTPGEKVRQGSYLKPWCVAFGTLASSLIHDLFPGKGALGELLEATARRISVSASVAFPQAVSLREDPPEEPLSRARTALSGCRSKGQSRSILSQ